MSTVDGLLCPSALPVLLPCGSCSPADSPNVLRATDSHYGRVNMGEPSGDECEPVLLNTFVIKKQRCRVYFHRGLLKWESEGDPYSKFVQSDLESAFSMLSAAVPKKCCLWP